MEYNIKLSKGKININGKEYDIPREVAEFIIYETSTRDDIIQTRDIYKRTIDKAIEYIESKNNGYCIKNGEEKGAFTFLLDFDKAREFIWKLLEILKEVE